MSESNENSSQIAPFFIARGAGPAGAMTRRPSLFQTYFMGGFECSTHRRRDGRRLDIIAATRHDEFAAKDYRSLANLGIRTVRDGIRWHLIEAQPKRYDFSSVLNMLRAARRTGTQVIWDLFHYGWPDDIDIFSPEFVFRFGKMARAFAGILKNETDDTPFLSPVNEISFVSWAGGDEGFLNPFASGRDGDIKAQLVRATIEAIEAVRDVLPRARFVQCEPAIHIVGKQNDPRDQREAEMYHLAQFQALDMITGKIQPELGGGDRYLDILGINYYYNNQWMHNGITLYCFHPRYRPFREILKEFYDRYQRPIFVAETGIEGEARPGWLGYISAETRGACDLGVPMEGICLYPILNHPGWENERHCHNGLLDYPDQHGGREAYRPLARELACQQELFGDCEALPMAGGQ